MSSQPPHPEGAEPWSRLPDESDKAFKAFQIYLRLGTGRAITKVAREYHRHTSLIAKWCRKNKWVSRCQAWEDEQDRLQQADLREEVKRLARRNANIALAAQRRVFDRIDKMRAQDIKPSMLPSWIRALSESEKVLRGTPTLNIELAGKKGGPIEHTIEHGLAEATESLIRKLGAELGLGEEAPVFDEPDAE